MKKTFALIVSLCLMLTLFSACGNKTANEATADPSAGDVTPAPLSEQALQSADFDGFSVGFTGAETFTDADGDSAIRIYYDFCNHSDTATSAGSLLIVTATQNGTELTRTEAAEESKSEYAENDKCLLQKDAAIRCILEYKLPGAEMVTVTLDDFDEHKLNCDFAPNALSGAPQNELTQTVSEPTLPDGLQAEAALFDMYEVKLTGGELTEGKDSEKLLRVNVEYTNVSGGEDAVPGGSCVLVAYQDGVELEQAEAAKPTAEDGNLMTELAEGESLTASVCFALKSESPVELQLIDNWERAPLAGLIIPVK